MRRRHKAQDSEPTACGSYPVSCALRSAFSRGVFLPIYIFLLMSCSLAQSEFDADRAFGYLQKQCEFGPRPPGSVAHDQTLNFLLSELGEFAREVVPQRFVHNGPDGPVNLTNIIAFFGPEVGRKVLLAAHWDTRPFADCDPDPAKRHLPILGANDGASGVAVLLELGRAFHLKPPPVQVILVLFDGEDYGKTADEMFLGSRYFARNLDDRWEPEYGILIDMVGDKNLDIPVEPNSAIAAPDIVKKVWELADELRLDGFHNEYGPAVLDDHIPLIQAGIKCIDIIDFNYPYWHSLEDTPDKCSPKSLETVGTLLLELIRSH